MADGWLEDPEFVRRLGPVAILGGLVILSDQVSQMALSLPGFTAAFPMSRFQAASLFVSRFTAVALGGLLLYAGASWGRWNRVVWVAAGVLAVTTALLIGAFLVLWFDGPAVKDQMPPGRLSDFVIQWIRVLAMAALGSLAGIGLLIAGRRRPGRS